LSHRWHHRCGKCAGYWVLEGEFHFTTRLSAGSKFRDARCPKDVSISIQSHAGAWVGTTFKISCQRLYHKVVSAEMLKKQRIGISQPTSRITLALKGYVLKWIYETSMVCYTFSHHQVIRRCACVKRCRGHI
jgi:hypothetical protein